MVTPTKRQILERAKRIEISDIVGKGLPAITPEDYELKESGAYHRAKMQLMSPKSTAFSQQEKYLNEMANEMGLVVFARKKVKELEQAEKRLQQIEKRKAIKVEPNGHSIMFLAHMLKPRIPFKMPKIFAPKISVVKAPKPQKKRQRLHTGRNGKTPRYLRKRIKDGQKSFSFPDSVWKIRSPRGKRR